MKNKAKPLILFTAALLVTGISYSQQSVNATGGDASGTGGTASYSVGQAVYTTHSGTTGSVSQGVQHAYEIYTLDIKEIELNISLAVFPNPTTDNLTLQVKDGKQEKLSYQLYDMQGKLLNSENLTSQETTIEMKDFAKATYFINVVNDKNQKVQSFKVIKN